MKKFNNLKPYITNIFSVISIFLLTLIICKISPFGENLLGKSDAIAQYKPMLFNFLTSLKKGILESYTFNNGLGNPFMFNYTYYLISPLNLIGLLFKNGELMYLSVILIKISFTAIFTTYYSKKHNCTNLVSWIVTISYVFSSWFLAYYYNIMWLDTFMIFPLFQYGLEDLIKNKNIYFYIFSLAYLYITNFYLAFSVLVYGLIYYIIRNFFYEQKNLKEKFKNFILFLLSTLITILLILFYLAILVNVKKQTGLGTSNVDEAGYITTLLDFIKSLFYGNTTITTAFTGNTAPNIATNTIILISTFFFFVNKKIKLRDKAFALIGLNFVTAAIFIKNFDYILNMFHNVIGLTFRYSFIIVFLSLILFIHNSKNINIKENKKCLLIINIILLIFLFLNYNNMNFTIFVLNLIIILCYSILIIIYNKTKLYKSLIIIIITIQTILATCNGIPTDLKKETIDYNSFKTEIVKYRTNKLLNEKNDFLNKNMYTNDKTTYLFTSMTYKPVLSTVGTLGCESGDNAISCPNNNDLFNMLFNVNNKYYLEKIYSVNNNYKEIILSKENTAKSYEDLIYAMTGIKNIFNKKTLKAETKDSKNYFYTKEQFYFIDVTIDDTTINYPQSYQEFYFNNQDIKEVTIYTIDEKKLKEVYEILNKNQIKYTKYQDSHLEGTINVDKNQMIFTSIPYDESWEIKIDGKKVKATKTLDSLIGIECKEGTHTISMEYKTDYKKEIIISSITFIILLLSMFVKRKKNENDVNPN